jgi:hypothetical protein
MFAVPSEDTEFEVEINDPNGILSIVGITPSPLDPMEVTEFGSGYILVGIWNIGQTLTYESVVIDISFTYPVTDEDDIETT